MQAWADWLEGLVSFHSTKEGFKVNAGRSIRSGFSRFHSTKEGFKAFILDRQSGGLDGFPFHQGRFQGF